MDIKDQVTKVVEKVTKDKSLLTSFEKNPVKTVEGIVGTDLPDDVIKQIVDGVKSKVGGNALTKGLDAIKKLF